jgi:hypothetical protein
MATLDAKLIGRVTQLRQKISEVERAELPVSGIVAKRLTEFDANVASARSFPFRFWHPTYGKPPSVAETEMLVEASFALLFPTETRALIERTTRARAEARPALRMSAEEKAETLSTLRGDLVVALAKLEQARRRVEQDSGEMLPRTAADDPGVWLAVDSDLALLAAGRPVPPDIEQRSNNHAPANHAATAGRI